MPLLAGTTPSSRSYKLESQRVPIRGVVVDNANSTVDVYVYQGESPSGVPFIVKAGWSRGFSVDGSSAVYITFNGVPSAAGSVYICVSSEPETAFSTQVANVTVTGTVPVTGMVGVTNFPPTQNVAGSVGVNNFPATQPVSGSVGVSNFPATQNIQAVSQYPAGSTAWATQIAGASMASAITLFSSTQPFGTVLYLSRLRINGMNAQAIAWAVAIGGVFNAFSNPPAGLGDVDDVYNPPIYLATWTSVGVGSLLLQTADTLVGVVNVFGYAAGYYK